jgi:hypothetical protein
MSLYRDLRCITDGMRVGLSEINATCQLVIRVVSRLFAGVAGIVANDRRCMGSACGTVPCRTTLPLKMACAYNSKYQPGITMLQRLFVLIRTHPLCRKLGLIQ